MNRLPLLRTALYGPLLTLAGCFSTATLHTARPITPGSWQGGVALGSSVNRGPSDDGWIPSLEAQLRYGCHERLDAGIHLTNFTSLGIDANVALLLGERSALSIDPCAQWYGPVRYYWLPVLLDFYTREDLTLTASVRPGYMDVRADFDEDEDEVFPFDDVRTSANLLGLGLAAHCRTGAHTCLVPELGVTWIDPEDGDRFVVYSVSLGFVF